MLLNINNSAAASSSQTASTSEVGMVTGDSDVLSPPHPMDMLAESSEEDSMSEDNGEWKEVSDAEGDWEQITSRKRKGNPRNDSPRRSSDDNTFCRLMRESPLTRSPSIIKRSSVGKSFN